MWIAKGGGDGVEGSQDLKSLGADKRPFSYQLPFSTDLGPRVRCEPMEQLKVSDIITQHSKPQLGDSSPAAEFGAVVHPTHPAEIAHPTQPSRPARLAVVRS